jgi:hypothetical protein
MNNREKGRPKSHTQIDHLSSPVIRVSEEDNAVRQWVGVKACLPPARQSLIIARRAS